MYTNTWAAASLTNSRHIARPQKFPIYVMSQRCMVMCLFCTHFELVGDQNRVGSLLPSPNRTNFRKQGINLMSNLVVYYPVGGVRTLRSKILRAAFFFKNHPVRTLFACPICERIRVRSCLLSNLDCNLMVGMPGNPRDEHRNNQDQTPQHRR